MSNSHNPWKKISSKIIHSNPYFKVKEDEVVRPNGKEGKYYVVESPDSVVIVPLVSHNEIYLVGLYRYTTQMFSWELPAGSMENQNAIDSAQRELQEETGLTAETFEEIGVSQAMNGSMSQLLHIVLAKNVRLTGDNQQEDEGISQVKKVAFKEALTMIKNDEITDSHTIAALMVASVNDRVGPCQL